MPESVKKSFVIFTYFVLILSTLLVFWQVRNFDFINYDDDSYVSENPHVLNGLTEDGVIWAFTTNRSANWHPLTWLSLMLDCQLFCAASLSGGANPGWMHLMNLILHLANTLLLFAILKKMTGALWPSAFVAAAFALHPMHVESVAWIAERKDVLCTLFLLLTLAAYAGYVNRPSVFRYIAAFVAFALGLMAKPMLVTLPFLLLLLDYWPLNRFAAPVRDTFRRKGKPPDQIRNFTRRSFNEGGPQSDTERSVGPVSEIQNSKFSILNSVFEKIPFFVLASASSVITFLVQRAGSAMIDINALPLKYRTANAFLSYARYISKMFWPQNLAVFYPFDIRNNSLLWQGAMCVLLLLVISILVIRFGRNQKYLPVGWFWFVVTLVPVIGLVQVGYQAFADRYTYISYIGLFIMIAWGLPELLSKWPQRKIALGLSMVMALTTLGICTHQQISYWNNSFTLFSHAIKVTQNNYVAYNICGMSYNNLGRYQDAIESYKQAIIFKPDYVEAHYNLGVVYGALSRWQEAIESYKQAIRIKPDYAKAYLNLGVSYEGLGRWQEAIESYKQAIQIEPDYAKAYYNLGVVCSKLGRWQDAAEAYKQAIRIKPDFVLAHYNLGVAYLVTGDKDSALEEYKILKTLDAEKANELFKLIDK
jgi:tetratricopeptide (TPR) repeat protein